jgi:UDPglucose--hexose-1-phosphate uridylyltransferase
MELRRERITAELLDPQHAFERIRLPLEIRWDPLTGQSCRLLPEGSLAPPELQDLEALAAQSQPTCPFCAERIETVTPRFPPELWPDGRIRCGDALLFPNLVPYSKWSSVSVYSPRHHLLRLDELTPSLLAENFMSQVTFARAVLAHDPSSRWVSVNANQLPPSGSSIFHPHLQGSANPVPTTVQRLFADRGPARVREYLELEQRDGERLIASTGRVDWVAAFAPVGPAEIRAFVADAASPESWTSLPSPNSPTASRTRCASTPRSAFRASTSRSPAFLRRQPTRCSCCDWSGARTSDRFCGPTRCGASGCTGRRRPISCPRRSPTTDGSSSPRPRAELRCSTGRGPTPRCLTSTGNGHRLAFAPQMKLWRESPAPEPPTRADGFYRAKTHERGGSRRSAEHDPKTPPARSQRATEAGPLITFRAGLRCAPLLAAVADVSLDMARAALRRLAPLAGPAEIDALRSQMLELDIGVVGDVAAALRVLGDAGASRVAVAALEDESGFKRQKAAVALRELRDPKTREPVHAALHDAEAAVRRSAVDVLGQLTPNRDTTEALESMLHDRDPSVRAAAVTALAALDESAAASLQPAVVDSHARVRRAAAAASARLNRESVRVLIGDPDADVRAEVLWALAASPRIQLVEVVAASVGDDSWHVRRAGCHALGASGLAVAKDPLLQALVDPHPMVRAAALGALESLLDERLVEELAAELRRPDTRLRRALVEALADRGETAERALLSLVSDPVSDVRLAVAHALARSQRPDAQQALARLADEPDAAVRHAATMLPGAAADGS